MTIPEDNMSGSAGTQDTLVVAATRHAGKGQLFLVAQPQERERQMRYNRLTWEDATGQMRVSDYREQSLPPSVALEVLNRAFVFLGRRAGAEGAEIASPLGTRIHLARIQPVFPGAELANHVSALPKRLGIEIVALRRAPEVSDVAAKACRRWPQNATP